jgi:peptidoglycan/LPS O-acetylase OafA/YrhL
MNISFNNYEKIKLNILHPNLFYFAIILLFLIFIGLTLKKEDHHKLLDASHSVQLKGLAIFFVILNHLFVHVSDSKPNIIFQNYAVSMFLILSGFGITFSNGGNRLDLKQFFKKRVFRVMIPYWITTVAILILDFVILDRVLPIKRIMLTLLGINIYKELNGLDYVRWFVTFILLWYLIFVICQNMLKISKIPYVYILISLFLLLMDYYFFHIGWYAYFAFPVGCILAIYYKEISRIYSEQYKIIKQFSFIVFFYTIILKIILTNQIVSHALSIIFPDIFLGIISEINIVIVNVGLIMITGHFMKNGFESKLLVYLGKYSYELMLLHGMFLIKYNPILMNSNDIFNFIGFIILIIIVFGLSIMLSKFNRLIYHKIA